MEETSVREKRFVKREDDPSVMREIAFAVLADCLAGHCESCRIRQLVVFQQLGNNSYKLSDIHIEIGND